MSRYDFVLLSTQSDDFVARLRELGLVDITTTGWEPSEQERQLVVDIDHYRKAIEQLHSFADSEQMQSGASGYATGAEAFDAYVSAQQQRAALTGDIARLEKMTEELEPWGEFSVELRDKLAEGGVVLRYFIASPSDYDQNAAEWGAQHTIVEIGRTNTALYFVVVAKPDEEIMLDAQEIKAPAMDYRQAAAEAEQKQQELKTLDAEFSRCAVCVEKIEEELSHMTRQLQNVKIKSTATEAADGALVVMEGCSST